MGAGDVGGNPQGYDPHLDLAPGRLLDKSILGVKRGQKPAVVLSLPRALGRRGRLQWKRNKKGRSWLQGRGSRGGGQLYEPHSPSRHSSLPPPPGSLPCGPLPFKATSLCSHLRLTPWDAGTPQGQGQCLCHPASWHTVAASEFLAPLSLFQMAAGN